MKTKEILHMKVLADQYFMPQSFSIHYDLTPLTTVSRATGLHFDLFFLCMLITLATGSCMDNNGVHMWAEHYAYLYMSNYRTTFGKTWIVRARDSYTDHTRIIHRPRIWK